MSFVALKLKPSVNIVQSPLLLEAGFVTSLNIRFFQGCVQLAGFFQRLTSNIANGVCRGLFPWADTSGNQYIAEGTTQELAVYNNGNLYNITPVMGTVENLSTPYTTTMGQTSVTITDSSDQAVVGNYININLYSSVANLILQGIFQIQTIGSGTFTINAPIAATSSTTGGVTSKFTTTMSSRTVKVTLANHGYSTGQIYTVFISTAVGGVTLYGQYVIGTIIDADNFDITAATAATSGTNVFENSDQVQIQYLLSAGLVSQGGVSGYGQMPYGIGPYGLGIQENYLPLRQWFFGAWGSFLIAQYTNGPIYVWEPANGFFSNPATIISQAPAFNTMIFVAMSQQQIIALGAQDSVSGLQDPMLIRWCDVADFTDWIATVTNQAGSFRLSKGSKIVGGIQIGLQGLIWTDIGLWSMQYIGYPLVYGFTEIAEGCGLISARAMGVLGNVIIWMSQKGFFIYSGGTVTPIPCPLWDLIFNNINLQQVDKITGAPNSSFTEFAWHLPSASGNGENDTVVKINLIDGSWDYSNGSDAQIYVRTAWVDQSIIGPPMGIDLNGVLQQAETGFSADGNPIISSARTGWFKLQDGLAIIFLERLLPDFVITGMPNLTISVFTVNYPGDTPNEIGPQNVIVGGAQQEYIIIRSRSRLAAIQIDCTSEPPIGANPGAFWRLGEPLLKTFPAGMRP